MNESAYIKHELKVRAAELLPPWRDLKAFELDHYPHELVVLTTAPLEEYRSAVKDFEHDRSPAGDGKLRNIDEILIERGYFAVCGEKYFGDEHSPAEAQIIARVEKRGFKRSEALTKDDPRGPEYGCYEVRFNFESGEIEVRHEREAFNLYFRSIESFEKWAGATF